MNVTKLIIATLLMILGQVGSFLQLQGGIKFGWYEKYLWGILLCSVPISYIYIRAVNLYVDAFDGQIWTSRLIGFALGIMVFTILSTVLFLDKKTSRVAGCFFIV